MIEILNKPGTLKLIVAMKDQAERDIRLYGKRRRRGSDRVSESCYESAVNYLNVEFPVIREILGECFKE